MKRFNPPIVFFLLSVFLFSCSKSYYPVKFRTGKTTLLQGDSINVSWKIKGKKKQFSYALLNGNTTLKTIKGDTFLKLENDTLITFSVYGKRGKKLAKRRKKVRVKIPEITSFSAFRNRFSPQEVTLAWNTKNIKNVSIEGYQTNLPPIGSITITEPNGRTFNLLASTPFKTVSKSCFVDEINTKEVFIETDTAIDALTDNRKIKMRILENDISGFPQEIKLKVLVYDSLGNFITGLAPPFGTEEISKKFFKQVIEKSGDKLKNHT
ncbi:MAG: hypothetical protein J7L46_06210, partial [Bacteroidales bacterium]|nr:hypothetical protein [Bacteroidales bacterium]